MAGAGTAMMVGLLGYMLVVGLSAEVQKHVEQTLVLLNLRPPAPPPRLHPNARVEPHKAKASGAASPHNLKRKATDVVAPRPLRPPPPPSVVSAPVPALGAASASGATPLRGPGQGAGGEGIGPGSGGAGQGEGDDGEPPRLIKGRLRMSDIPAELMEPGRTRTVGVSYHVDAQGYVSDCRPAAPSGSAALDRLTCRLIEERFRFRPSRDAEGRPVETIIEEDHSWIFDRPSDRP